MAQIWNWLVKHTDTLIPLVDLLTSTVLAAIVVYIAWQQYRTNRGRLESERRDRDWQRQYSMFERRWEVYTGVRKYLEDVTRDLKPEPILRAVVDLQQLQWIADVLFASEVNAYLKELLIHGLKLRKWTEQREKNVGDSAACHGQQAELAWFSQQYDAVVDVFADELRLSRS